LPQFANSVDWAREVPTTGGMRTAHETKVRAALWRLTASEVAPDDGLNNPPPLFLRAPSIALLWIATLITLVGLLALSRIRLPHIDRDRPMATSHH
jgi:hypothetical protein